MALKTRGQEEAIENCKPWRWQKGQSGNPKGVSSQAAMKARQTAMRALEAREIMSRALLSSLEAAIENADTEEQAANSVRLLMTSNNIRFLKESEDRGLGTAVQSVIFEGTHEHGTPKTITRRIVDPASGAGDSDTKVGDTPTPD